VIAVIDNVLGPDGPPQEEEDDSESHSSEEREPRGSDDGVEDYEEMEG
jgi:hypothetical protein